MEQVEQEKCENKDYTLALDIGTNSIGWAVIGSDMRLVKKKMAVYNYADGEILDRKKRDLWGSLLYEKALAEKDTPTKIARIKRASRRRLRRRKWRLRELRRIFEPEIKNIDPDFFARLDKSFLNKSDKDKFENEEQAERYKYPIFGDKLQEKKYHKKYPTIYHLRKALIEKDDKVDLRLVFLALSHILKYRGHFLQLTDPKNFSTEDILQIGEKYNEFLQSFCDKFNLQEVTVEKDFDVNIIDAKKRKDIFDEVVESLSKQEGENIEEAVNILKQLNNLILGKEEKFSLGDEKIKLSFAADDAEIEMEKLSNCIWSELLIPAKALFFNLRLIDILKLNPQHAASTTSLFSAAKIAHYNELDEQEIKESIKSLVKKFYEKHKKDQENFKEKCQEFFEGKTNADKIINFLNDDFIKWEKAKEEDKKAAREIVNALKTVKSGRYLYKQRCKDNACIPYQVQWLEMKEILEKQKKHYHFLEKNEDKILQLLACKIPYYVGPLIQANKNKSRFAWLVKEEQSGQIKQEITPWNLNETINKEKTAQAFIDKLVGKDTYLPNERVLPKASLIYQKFCILNELTKVRYKNNENKWDYFDKNSKEKIIQGLFCQYKEVSEKRLQSFIHKNLNLTKNSEPEISGIDGKFNAQYSTYIDLKNAGIEDEFLKVEDNTGKLEVIEKIIQYLTAFEDRDIRKEKIKEACKEAGIKDEVADKLVAKHYKGWGNLSKKLIYDIRTTNEGKNIIDLLLEGNCNFMQLIKKLPFAKEIADAKLDNQKLSREEWLNSLCVSANVKRGLRLCDKLIDEIKKVMGSYPKTVVIEMAREHQDTVKTASRYSKLSKILHELKKAKEMVSEQLEKNLEKYEKNESALLNDKLYLYFLQEGKDLYSGEPLDFDKIASGNNNDYQIDHIMPRCKIKDNSLDNRVLTHTANNQNKGAERLDEKIINRNKPLWQALLRKGFMSKRKYDLLTNPEFCKREEEKFAQRQLVETRQITKNLAAYLHTKFDISGSNKTEIFMPNAKLVSNIRNALKLYKIRELNDMHHAQDAYLNGVVSLNLNNAPKYYYKPYYQDPKQSASEKKQEEIDTINKLIESLAKKKNLLMDVLNKSQVNVVKHPTFASGKFWDETIYFKSSNKAKRCIKKDMNVELYGGYNNTYNAYFALVETTVETKKGKRKSNYNLEAIPIADREIYEQNPQQYLEAKIGKGKKVKIIEKALPYNTLFEYANENSALRWKDCQRFYLSGGREMHNARQFVLSPVLSELLYCIAKIYDANDVGSQKGNFEVEEYLWEMFKKNVNQLDNLYKSILEFLEKYKLFDSKRDSKRNQLPSICTELSNKAKALVNAGAYDYKKEDFKDIINKTMDLLKLTTAAKAGGQLKYLFDYRVRYQSMPTSQTNGFRIIFQSLSGLKEVVYDPFPQLEEEKN